jgi:hypothetical protein
VGSRRVQSVRPGTFLIAISSHHHDRKIRESLLDLCQQLEPVHARHVMSDRTATSVGWDGRRAPSSGQPTRASLPCHAIILTRPVEKKVMRQLAHAQKRGFGWERWSRQLLYDTLGLFDDYRVRRDRLKVAPAG